MKIAQSSGFRRHPAVGAILSAALVLLVWSVSVTSAADTRPLQSSVQQNTEAEQALDSGDYNRAVSLFQSALKSKRSNLEEANLRAGLSECYLWTGDFKSAKTEIQKALKLTSKDSGPVRSRVLDDLSWFDQAQNRIEDSTANAKKALDLRHADKDRALLPYVNSLRHMAYLNELQGQLQEAREFYQQAIEAYEKSADANPIMTADLKEKLAAILWRIGMQKEAGRLFGESLYVKNATGAVWEKQRPQPYWEDVILRYEPGSPNCTQQFDNGSNHAIVTANGVTISAGLVREKNDKVTRIDVTVANHSERPIDFLSAPPSMVVLAPRIAAADQIDPSDFAARVENRGEKKAAWTRFWGQDATRPITTTMYTPNGYWAYPPVYTSQGMVPPTISRSGNTTTIISQVPDYEAQARAMQKAAEIAQKARARAEEIRSRAIGPSHLEPGQSASGSLYFDAAGVEKVVVRMPVGNATFEFQLPPSQN